jgi:hypothetical protein
VSYCRWSSDDWKSDVYVYEDVDGYWSIHIAGRRVVFAEPLPPPVTLPHPFTEEQFHAWWERSELVAAIRDRSEMVDIGLPHVGETFEEPTPGAAADRLAYLRGLGYHVPDGVIKTLREEQTERADLATSTHDEETTP